MKRENLSRAVDICANIKSYEQVVSLASESVSKIKLSLDLGGRAVTIPPDHLNFLRRVIRDTYQAYIDKLQVELESL